MVVWPVMVVDGLRSSRGCGRDRMREAIMSDGGLWQSARLELAAPVRDGRWRALVGIGLVPVGGACLQEVVARMDVARMACDEWLAVEIGEST